MPKYTPNKGHKAHKSTTKTLASTDTKNQQSFPKKHALPRWSSPHQVGKESSSRRVPQPGTGETKPHRPYPRSPPGSTSTTTGPQIWRSAYPTNRTVDGNTCRKPADEQIHTNSTSVSAGVALLTVQSGASATAKNNNDKTVVMLYPTLPASRIPMPHGKRINRRVVFGPSCPSEAFLASNLSLFAVGAYSVA